MDLEAFATYLRRGGRSDSAVKRCLHKLTDFAGWLEKDKNHGLPAVEAAELHEYVYILEREGRSAKTALWALGYFFRYSSQEDLRLMADEMRRERITRRPFQLNQFRALDPNLVDTLAGLGLNNVEQMLDAGRHFEGRLQLATRAGVPVEAITEIVKLSDLARVPGLKGVRARLYLNAGVDTLDALASWEPDALHQMLTEYVKQSGFEGLVPWPKEVAFSVRVAGEMERLVDYTEPRERIL